MELSVIIVSYNVKSKLEQNLSNIFKFYPDFSLEVFVVDNASIDGSAEMVAEKFPQVKLIRNEKNLGFARANNIAWRQSRGDFILLLNPDMLVFPETFYNSLTFARKHPQAVVSSCLLLDGNNKIIKHVRRFPAWIDQLLIILKIPHLFPVVLKSYLLPDFNYNLSQKVDSVRGSFFLINRAAYEKIISSDRPPLDERYFLWFEEVDFCRQVYKLGGEVWYNAQAFCRDYVGQSFSLLKRGRTQKYFSSSMLKYFKKWQPAWQYYLLRFFWPLGKFLTFVFSRWAGAKKVT